MTEQADLACSGATAWFWLSSGTWEMIVPFGKTAAHRGTVAGSDSKTRRLATETSQLVAIELEREKFS